MEIKFDVYFKRNLGTLFKSSEVDLNGKHAHVNIPLALVDRLEINYLINGNKKYTDDVLITDITENLIQIPFKSDVMKSGVSEFEIIAYMKNGDVKVSQTYTYNIDEAIGKGKQTGSGGSSDSHTHSNLNVLNSITQSKISEWNNKANSTHSHSEYANYSHTHNASEIEGLENVDIDLSDYYTKSETYNKTEIDSKIANMGAGGSVDLSNYYTKSETDEAMNDKANKVHTHNEYLTELPTHTHSEYLKELPSHEHEQYLTEHQDISHKADKSDIYTKIQTDNKISEEIAKIEVGDKHTHSNLSVLNNITQTKVNEWNNKANASHTHSDYANKTHTHTEYAPSNHTHNYASTSHTHSDYANKTHTHSTSDISNLSNYISDLITKNAYVNSLKSTIDTLSSELAKVKKDIEALKNNSGSNGGSNNGGGGNEGGGSSSSNLKTDKTSYTINPTEMLNISYTTSASIPSSCAWELRQNGSYLCSAYKDTSTGKVVCYTGSLSTGAYNNITLVAKEYQTDVYVDIATSNVFSITVGSSSSGGSGGGTTLSEYEESCKSEYILDKMYPMGQAHEAIPSGLITDTWKHNSRWENQNRPYAMSHSCGQSGCPGTGAFQALGCWSNVYRVEGTPFTQNTGVEMKDIKVYGWYNGKWELVQHLPVPNGNFYPESFGGDVNKYFADSVKQTSASKTIILREANKIQAMNWNTGQLQTENCMYHPFSDVKNFDTKYEYIYTCIDLRKVKWDENGVDDRDQTHYCSNCGGDWWLAEGLLFHDSWQHNKGVAQPKMIEITKEWRRFSMTTVPQGWSNGFPK